MQLHFDFDTERERAKLYEKMMEIQKIEELLEEEEKIFQDREKRKFLREEFLRDKDLVSF